MKNLLEFSGADLFDFIKAIGAGYNDNKKKKPQSNVNDKNNYLNGSISNYTKNLILTFPTLCDNSLPPSTASMISRANERSIVSMLEMLFSSMQLNGKTGVEVLASIHKNINVNMSMDDAIDAVDDYIEKNGLNESVLTQSQLNECLKIMTEQLKTPQRSFPVESLSERSLNGYSVYNIHGRIVVREDISDDYYDQKIDLDAKDDQRKDKREKREKEMHPINKQGELLKNTDYEVNSLQRQLMDSDIKKSNEMQPTLMVVRFNELDTEGKIYSQKPFVAGVKSRLISVDPSDIIDRVIVKNKTKVNFLNFIRATTGEIKFFRDFIFCMDQAKIDAKNSVKKGEAAKMWKVLEDRSSKNFRNKHKRVGNDASAITTLVLNQETVNILKKEHDFDIEKISNARMILDAYNLLGLFIADESIEVLKILYAGNDTFEQQAYSYLEKEAKDNSYKKVINLIGKMNGR